MRVWLNGALVADSAARIDPADRGFTLGDGLFETIRVAEGRACHLDRHFARLRAGLDLLDLALPWDEATLGMGMAALVGMAGLTAGALRLTVSRGPAPRGLLPPERPAPTVLITVSPPAPAHGPVRAVIARGTRRNEHSPLSRVKALSALDLVLARQEAARAGADDALLLNTAGRLAEASYANLFLVLDGQLLTPPAAEGALPGIRRGLILESGAASERPLAEKDISRASEILLTNSLGVRAVVAVDGRPVGDGMPGPVFRQLAERTAAA